MQGNKKDKNRKKKSWQAKNMRTLCCCFYCEGNWYTRHIEKTRARKKDIKNKRHSVTMVGFDI